MRHRHLSLAVLLLTLAGCSGDGLDDLREFVKNAHAGKKPQVEPIPEIKPYEAFAYSAADLSDPFSAANLLMKQAAGGGGLRPDLNRRKEPLEEFPLDALRMVGTLSKGQQQWAVVKAPDGTIHRAQVGSHLGQNFGKVIRISEEKVDLLEHVQAGTGQWIEREASLALPE